MNIDSQPPLVRAGVAGGGGSGDVCARVCDGGDVAVMVVSQALKQINVCVCVFVHGWNTVECACARVRFVMVSISDRCWRVRDTNTTSAGRAGRFGLATDLGQISGAGSKKTLAHIGSGFFECYKFHDTSTDTRPKESHYIIII